MLKLKKIHELLADKIKMISEVHDSKWFYIKTAYLDNILPNLINIIQDVPKIFMQRFGIEVPFKFPVDAEIGPSFGELKSYKQ